MSDLFWLSEVDGGGLIVFAPRFVFALVLFSPSFCFRAYFACEINNNSNNNNNFKDSEAWLISHNI